MCSVSRAGGESAFKLYTDTVKALLVNYQVPNKHTLLVLCVFVGAGVPQATCLGHPSGACKESAIMMPSHIGTNIASPPPTSKN